MTDFYKLTGICSSQLKCVNADTLLMIGPALLLGIHGTSINGKNTVNVYDGVNNSAELKVKLELDADKVEGFNLVKPVPFNIGLFVECEDTDTYAMIEFQSISRVMLNE